MPEPRFVPLSFERLQEPEQIQRSRAFLARMRTRRTVRHFSSEPVAYELVENAIATAGTAPRARTSNRGRSWRLRAAAEEEERRSYEGRMPNEWLEALRPLGTDWRKPHLEDAPFLIVVFEQAYGLQADGSRVKHYYVKESVGIATGLLLASLHEVGLATLTHTPSPMGFLREVLGRPENERPYVLIPVGYPAEGCVVPDLERKPLGEISVRLDSPG